MTNSIHLLPDAVANQIAAGEVIQRPASAVKELIENAVDAGATNIKVILKEAGKALIQVIDNGSGMNETDARMCFERHATSKLHLAEDLFKIRTMGFRGEAMASIAAVAHVELKTKRKEDLAGTLLRIESSQIISMEPCSSIDGTSISIRNLFFSIPARRNFLKSNAVELRHIIDEFQRQALANPSIFFSLHHDNNELFHLPISNLKQRIAGIFGNNYIERLVPVEEETEQVGISGFIGKPEFAKKTRGEQFFFVNNRFIKDAYLNHAINNAFNQLLPEGSYPFYVLFLEVEPEHLDINVHPTKTEIKFEDEKIIYAVLRSAVKRSLGKYNISPTIDFQNDNSFRHLKPFDPNTDSIRVPSIEVNADFNPFGNTSKTSNQNQAEYLKKSTLSGWETIYEIAHKPEVSQMHILVEEKNTAGYTNIILERSTFQLHQRYIITAIKTGILLIDQQAAHERVLFERYLEAIEKSQGASQQCLFPQTMTLNASDFELVKELGEDLKKVGFDIQEFGKNSIVIYGVPAEIESTNESAIVLGLLENYKQQLAITKFDKKEQLARALARQSAIKNGKQLSIEEMNNLIDELFACQIPQVGLNGKSSFIKLNLEDIAKMFN